MTRRFPRLRMILTLRCAEASRLSSAALDRPLSRTERVALRGHLLCCASCRRFRRQAWALRDLAREAGRTMASPLPQPSAALSNDARARIGERLRAESNR